MEPPEGGGKKGAALAGVFVLAILIALFFVKGLGGKPSVGGDGGGGEGDGEGGGAPGGGGAMSQTAVVFQPGGAWVSNAFNDPAIFFKMWPMAIDAIGSMLIDKLVDEFEEREKARKAAQEEAKRAQDKAKIAEEEKARGKAEEKIRTDADADAKARADADARAAAEAEAKAKADADARAAAEAEAKAKADADARATAEANAADAARRPPPETFETWDSHPLNDEIKRAGREAIDGEERYANETLDERVKLQDRDLTPPNQTDTIRNTTNAEIRRGEGNMRDKAARNLKSLEDVDDLQKQLNNERVKQELGARDEGGRTAANQDADAARAAENQANSDSVRTTADELKKANESKVKAEEEGTRKWADGEADRLSKGKKSRMARLMDHFKSGRIASANVRSALEGERLYDQTSGNPRERTPSDPPDPIADKPIDGGAQASFGTMPSEKLMQTPKGKSWFGRTLRKLIHKTNNSAFGRAASSMAASKVGKNAVKALGAVNTASDVMMVFQICADSFFYGMFPDEAQLITAKTIEGFTTKANQKQIDTITEYNKTMDRINESLRDYKWPRVQWPQIMGPLDSFEKHKKMRPAMESDYALQIRVQADVDAVRERLLYADGPFKDHWIGIFGQASYNAVKLDPTESLVDYVTGNFDGPVSDELYRQAYSNVCAYFGGIVYEDVRPAADPNWGGRPRFQCGWSKTECWNAARNWIDTDGKSGGMYAEWFTFDELNRNLNNLAIEPTADYSPITACAGTTGTKYNEKCSFGISHPLRRSGQDGMCIVTSATVAAICEKNNGRYQPETHDCEFSEEYCQAIGTCYDGANKKCWLPSESMFALSMVFGTGGPREWIRINGCNFGKTPEDVALNVLNMVCPLTSLFTANGQSFWNDMINNHANWDEGFKATLGNPIMAAVVASMAVGIFLSATATGAAVTGAVMSGIIAAGVSSAGATAGLSLIVMAIAIGIAMGAQSLMSNELQNKGPPDPNYGPYASEYTVGGWKDGVGSSAPQTLGFTDGWLTKPIPIHGFQNWPPAAVSATETVTIPARPGSVADFPDVQQIRFYCSDNLDGAYQPGFVMSAAVDVYTQTHEPPVCKRLCYQMSPSRIRVGADSSENKAWCMLPFPSVNYADTNNIGPLAPDGIEPGQTRQYMTSKTWTNGTDPTTPQYPFGEGENINYAVNGNQPGAWHYQLVYDKTKMVGMIDDPDEPGLKKGYPKHLWNTALLQVYFLDSTIQEMRQYYCNQALADDPDGSTVDSNCWGYVNVSFPGTRTTVPDPSDPRLTIETTTQGYKYVPMTIPGQMMSAATTPPAVPISCPNGWTTDYANNVCIAPQSTITTSAGYQSMSYGSSGGR